jgi:CheY-like chemotaxis protein
MGNDVPMQAYCPGCGEDVDVFVMMVEGVEGVEERRCIHCGLTLERKKSKDKEQKSIRKIISADDSRIIQSILSELLVEEQVAEHVEVCNNGMEFLTTLSKQFVQKQTVDLIILDVNMPILNGISAAIAQRAIEKGLGVKPIPIMFFTVKKCDETFQKVLKFCQPAKYLNKGVSSSPADIVRRISEVATQLLQSVK